jgi:hypothetical protein
MTATALTATPGFPPPESWPRLRFRVLRWIAARLPLRRITIQSKPYLDRYYIAGPVDLSTAGLFSPAPRERLGWLRCTWYLHRMHRADPRGPLHDHPWEGDGRVLAGAFVEQRAEGAYVRSEGERTRYPLGVYHRISSLVQLEPDDPACETWTLFRAARKINHWGYSVDGAHVPHEIYHARPGQGGPA